MSGMLRRGWHTYCFIIRLPNGVTVWSTYSRIESPLFSSPITFRLRRVTASRIRVGFRVVADSNIGVDDGKVGEAEEEEVDEEEVVDDEEEEVVDDEEVEGARGCAFDSST